MTGIKVRFKLIYARSNPMDDINLIPYEIRIREENYKKRIMYFTWSFVLIIFIAVITYLPIFLKNRAQNETSIIETEIAELSYIKNELESLKLQKERIQSTIEFFNDINKDNISSSDIINELSAMIPSDITVLEYNSTRDLINLDCTSKNQQSIAVFLSKLESSEKLHNVYISDIDSRYNNSQYNFSLYFNTVKTEEEQ
ncbi:PilN domain-containing protein [Oxobacter pfennigii]|nr:PilN domain-containing protein [Oxobacter pfennigii]